MGPYIRQAAGGGPSRHKYGSSGELQQPILRFDRSLTPPQEAGIDVRLCDVAAAIQETMESYEVEVKGKILPGNSQSHSGFWIR